MKMGKDGKEFYDRTQEHMDQSPLGKIQQQYWTTKQQVRNSEFLRKKKNILLKSNLQSFIKIYFKVMKKLGKKQDEFIVLSDAELDAKLDVTILTITTRNF